jgi:hypothetical protein
MKRLFFVAVILVAVGKANAAEITYAPRSDSLIDISPALAGNVTTNAKKTDLIT